MRNLQLPRAHRIGVMLGPIIPDLLNGFEESCRRINAVDEMDVVFKARSWVGKIPALTVPVSMEAYLSQIRAELRMETDLGPHEPGWSIMKKGIPCICVNAKDRPERQRFTICHEIAHFV